MAIIKNLLEQLEEIKALTAIYGKAWQIENEHGTAYSMQVTPDVKVFITFNPEYPSDKPPKYEMIAPVLTGQQKLLIKKEFKKIYSENCSSPVLFQWIEKLKQLLWCWGHITQKGTASSNNFVESEDKTAGTQRCQMQITHGPSIQDRKSVFQGHACKVKTQDDVKNFVDYLLTNKKIAQAKHNILAYRIQLPKRQGGILQDYDDDGESHAGGRVLHLLQIIGLVDVAVVVTRWYGGIHLGPDRFKHINNAARQALIEARFTKS